MRCIISRSTFCLRVKIRTQCAENGLIRIALHGATAPSISWWRHQMERFSALLALCAGNSPVTGEFPAQRPVTRSFDVSFDQCMNKWLSKQSRGWWFETQSWSLWRHSKDCSCGRNWEVVGQLTRQNQLDMSCAGHTCRPMFVKLKFDCNEGFFTNFVDNPKHVCSGYFHERCIIYMFNIWR